jgi:CubicO group peptidase (beta-lactamase class C family)
MKLVLSLLLVGFLDAHVSPGDQSQAIDRLMSALNERGQFNGSVLVALRGNIIYRNALGRANFSTNVKLTPETPFCLASVTKPFTAMAIMMLAEQHKLQYDDRVSKYIPEFSPSPVAGEITIRQLLTHTSGIPDFDDLGIDDSALNAEKLVRALLSREAALGRPGQRYRYSNPGYVLLAIIVKRVSGQSFSDFLDQRIFKPLGMNRTFVYDSPRKRHEDAATGYDQFGQEDDIRPTTGPGGDGGIYSTVDDLLKWDQALYTDQLVPPSALSLAFTPASVKEGRSTYGFGWNVGETGGGKYVWHTGKSAGFRAFIERRLGERVTVILLTNRGDSKRTEINDAILNILAGKPYVLPQRSGAEKLYAAIHESGLQAAMRWFDSLRRTPSSDYDFSEAELNTLGYKLLYGDKSAGDAIAIFRLNTAEHPNSSNAFDSLGEAYRVGGQKKLAVASYQKAIELDPRNLHARGMLKELE